MIRNLLLATAVLVGGAQAAQAAVVVDWFPMQVGLGPTAGQTLIRDFEGANGAAGITGNDFGLYTDTTPGTAATPMGNASQYLAVLNGGSATIQLPSTSAIWLDLGSVDTYNTLTINFVGGGSQSFTGSQLTNQPPSDGSQVAPNTNGRARFAGLNGEVFESITLTSQGFSFEVDNLATSAVPEPATWAMLIGGFGLIGSAMRRRRDTRVIAIA